MSASMDFKKTYKIQRLLFWSMILIFSLTIVGKAGACSDPSAMEMSQGKAMECCLERCRMEVTHEEAAREACASSRHALSPTETLSNPHNPAAASFMDIFSDFNPMPLFPKKVFEPSQFIKRDLCNPPIKRHASRVPIYTSIQTFLI